MAKLDIYQRTDTRWAWRLTARNGRIIATDGGQGYEHRTDCEAMARAIVTGAHAPAPDELPTTELPPGWTTLTCTDCDASIVGREGEQIEHTEGGAHVFHTHPNVGSGGLHQVEREQHEAER